MVEETFYLNHANRLQLKKTPITNRQKLDRRGLRFSTPGHSLHSHGSDTEITHSRVMGQGRPKPVPTFIKHSVFSPVEVFSFATLSGPRAAFSAKAYPKNPGLCQARGLLPENIFDHSQSRLSAHNCKRRKCGEMFVYLLPYGMCHVDGNFDNGPKWLPPLSTETTKTRAGQGRQRIKYLYIFPLLCGLVGVGG